MQTTHEFSFILKSSEHGIGVFVTHDIEKGSFLRLFGDERLIGSNERMLNSEDVPVLFRGYCIRKEDAFICPDDFGHMSVGWYMNHSQTPNAIHEDLNWYAARDIQAGEEILIDYNTLGEAEDQKEDYY